MTKTRSHFAVVEQESPVFPDSGVLMQDQREGRLLQEHIRPRSGQILHDMRFEHQISPALCLSGDAVDYFKLPDGRVLAYLLDVSGHGTAAALLSMFIKSMVRYSLAMRSDVTAAGVLSDVNEALLDAGLHKYATMLCVIFSPQQNELEWSHAGHTPRPVFWTERGARLLYGQSQPVGLFAGADYQNERLAMPERFALCMFSDGILDALPADDFAGREALLVQLVERCAGDFSRLASALIDRHPGSHPDDRSVFVISRPGHEQR